MDVTVVSNLIQNVGMGAAMLLASLYFIWYMYNKNREDLETVRKSYLDLLMTEQEKHTEETKAVTEAIANNTQALIKLSETLRGDGEIE
jgi:hypothetical protein